VGHFLRSALNGLETRSMLLLSSDVLRLLLAAFLGGAIGLERELSRKPAGLRTNMFICFGAAMFTIVSIELAGPETADKTRIASMIVTGIGFIGAGSILHSRGSVQGLTTAATIFVVASIGMATGGGLYLVAIFATIVILVALHFLGWVETRYSLKPIVMTYETAGDRGDEIINEINRILAEDHLITDSIKLGGVGGAILVHFTVNADRREHDHLLESLRQSSVFKRVGQIKEYPAE